MFTGIIQSFGIIENINNDENIYIIKTNLNLDDCTIGSSICCDGICLTVTKIIKKEFDFYFSFNVSEETINRSNLIFWKIGDKINIEKSLKVGDEISGHFVYGHIDTTLQVKAIKELENSWDFEFSLSSIHSFKDIKNLIVEKGSIAINGISLTIANVNENSFNVSIISHTFQNTNLSILKLNDIVNIEFDPLARYISARYAK